VRPVPGLGRGSAEPAAAAERDRERDDRGEFGADSEGPERPVVVEEMVGQQGEVLSEEAGEEAERQEQGAMIASCFMTTLSRFDTMDRCVSMAPVSRSR
jgi:hypothetical protein